MKIIEFFIAGKIVVESAGHSITNRRDPRDTNEARRVSERERTHQSKLSESMYLYPQTHMVIECVTGGNGADGNRATPTGVHGRPDEAPHPPLASREDPSAAP